MAQAELFAGRQCNGHRIQPVYGRVDDELAESIRALWQRYGALPQGVTAEQRLKQVVCVAWDNAGELAAINTVYPCELNNTRYFGYRLFIRPMVGNPQLRVDMTVYAADLLGSLRLTDKPQGLLIVLENPTLVRPQVKELLLANGYRHLGKNPQQQDVWVRDFPPTSS